METSTEIGKLTESLAKAQAIFLPVKRSINVDFTAKSGQRIKYSYAPLEDIFDSCRKALSDNGLAIMQPIRVVNEGGLMVETLLSHSSGEWIKSEIIIESESNSPQSKGSALTYARRYALSSLLGIASEEDDDAEKAMDRKEPRHLTTRSVDTAVGKVTPPPSTQAKPSQERTELKDRGSEVEESSNPPAGEIEGVDMAWVMDSMKRTRFLLPTLTSWLRSKANYTGLDTTGEIRSIVRRMNKEQKEFLVKELEDRMAMR